METHGHFSPHKKISSQILIPFFIYLTTFKFFFFNPLIFFFQILTVPHFALGAKEQQLIFITLRAFFEFMEIGMKLKCLIYISLGVGNYSFPIIYELMRSLVIHFFFVFLFALND